MKRVLLVTAPYHAGVVESAGRWPNLAFVYLAGELRRAGFAAEIYDAMTKNHDVARIARHIADVRPDVVATSAYTAAIYAALDVLRAAKEVCPGVCTVLGGVHAHFCYDEIFTTFPGVVDFIVRGEGEETLVDLLQAVAAGADPGGVRGLAYTVEGRPVLTAPRPALADIDALSPAWDLVDWSDYTLYPLPGSRLAIVDSSRGCPHDCVFCSQQKFWQRRWRPRRPEAVVADIEHLATTYGVNVVMLSDEYPTPDRQRWERLLDLLIERDLGVHLLMETRVGDILRDADIIPKYRAAGVLHLYVGVEATNQATLDLFKKDVRCEESQQAIRLINEAGMISECSFVLGLPDETPESIEATLQLARHYDPDMPHFLMIAPWPYADIYSALAEHIVTRDYAKYNFVEPVVKPRQMTTAQLQQAVVDCYRRFYMEKLGAFDRLADQFKRAYMLSALQAMVKNSFLAQHLTGLGAMPEELARRLGLGAGGDQGVGQLVSAEQVS